MSEGGKAVSDGLYGEDRGAREASCTIVRGAWQISETRGLEYRTETVAVEALADIFINGVYWASSMLSPADLEDYATGVLFTAGVIDGVDDIVSLDVFIDEAKDRVRIEVMLQSALCGQTDGLSQQNAVDDKALHRRGIPSAAHSWANQDTSCDTARARERSARLADWEPIDPAAVWRMSRSLLARQGMHRATGATHAAVFADRNGVPVLMREDVGRHNAVEKLVGAILKKDVNPHRGFVYLSSRCALELISKCARVGVALVATVSAPTSAVIEYGKREGIALLAFARDGRFTIYTHPELVCMPDDTQNVRHLDKNRAC